VLGEQVTGRFPPDRDFFSAGRRLGDSDFGLTAAADAPEGPSRALLSVEVGAVDPLLPRAGAEGGHFQGPRKDMPWGQRVAHVQDPDGNAVNLTRQL
jgi:predicted enzyme related to lactoylglutathione lyase